MFPYLRVHLHDGPVPALELEWLSYTSSPDLRAALRQVLELTLQHHAQAWIGDDRLLGAVRPRDLDWSKQQIMPSLDHSGLRRFALLEAQDALNRRLINGMYAETKSMVRFEIQCFEDIVQARAWATSQPL